MRSIRWSRRRSRPSNQKIGAFAVAAAIGVASIALFVATRGGPDTPRSNAPANTSTAPPVEIATDFFEAFDVPMVFDRWGDCGHLGVDKHDVIVMLVVPGFRLRVGWRLIA